MEGILRLLLRGLILGGREKFYAITTIFSSIFYNHN